MKSIPIVPVLLLLFAFCGSLRADSQVFVFGSAQAKVGATSVAPSALFGKGVAYGFEPGATLTVENGAVASDKAFYFSVRLPEDGNYRVTVKIGSDSAPSRTTVKAELRRLMVEGLATARGEHKTVSFLVNTRTPKIKASNGIAAGEVRLKAPRESVQEAWAWDDALTLEFNGLHPSLASLEITKVEVPTVFLLGDSTVCDQSKEPYASWGQMLPRFLKPEVAVANHGESGETYRDSLGRRRLDKILSLVKPGDYVFLQFGHNDQKQIAQNKGGPFTTYKQELRKHVEGVRERGGIPVVVSSMERRAFDAQGKTVPSLAEYAEAARQVAAEEKVAFIDLNALSKPLYEALEKQGADYSRKAFAGQDDTHHDNYGAYELAKCVIQGIVDAKLPLADHVIADWTRFDPAKPDSVALFSVPSSPQFTNQRPLGD